MHGNYVANAGLGNQNFTTTSSTDHTVAQGVFYNTSRLTLVAISDGTSNTAFVSEVITPIGNDLRGCMYYPAGTAYEHTNTPNSGTDQLRNGQFVSNDPRAPAIGTYNSYNDVNQVITARSRHTGGVNLLLGDGSVRFVSNSVSVVTWQALSTARGGETPGNF